MEGLEGEWIDGEGQEEGIGKGTQQGQEATRPWSAGVGFDNI